MEIVDVEGLELTVIRNSAEWLEWKKTHSEDGETGWRPTEFPCLAYQLIDGGAWAANHVLYPNDIEKMMAALKK